MKNNMIKWFKKRKALWKFQRALWDGDDEVAFYESVKLDRMGHDGPESIWWRQYRTMADSREASNVVDAD